MSNNREASVRTSHVSFIFVCAVTAGALAWPLSATADASPSQPSGAPLVLGGRALTPEEMSQVRGAYSRVRVTINGTVYEATDPAPTGSVSLTIPLGTNTYSRVRASTTNGGTATSTVTISGNVTFKTSP